MARQWTKKDLIRIFEYLLEHKVGITSHPVFRKLLDRDRNLFANQLTREATGNIAYRSVDFDLSGLSDDEVWQRFDASEYAGLIEENAAATLMKMIEKLKLEEESEE